MRVLTHSRNAFPDMIAHRKVRASALLRPAIPEPGPVSPYYMERMTKIGYSNEETTGTIDI